VYATLGTVHNDLGVFRLILDSLAGLDCNVTMTVGRDNDPLGLEPIPSNAFVDRYVAQSFVLPHATVVVSHGGSGSMLGAFAHGLPTLVLPRGAVSSRRPPAAPHSAPGSS
jgi:UDP:flavonoid glycosyltransferase YjiC (YdhE family)